MVATRKKNCPASKESPRPDLNVRVTERILTALRQHIVPWQQSHHRLMDGTFESPCNYSSGRRYSGQNLMMLEGNTHDRPYYLTYKQAQALGGQVQKGAKGEFIVFWKFDRETDGVGDRSKRSAYCQYSVVFHVSCIDGIHFDLPERVALAVADHEREGLNRAEIAVAHYLQREQIAQLPGGLKATYQPLADNIHMPEKEAYTHPGGYFKTVFHELIHSTGAAHRLNRPGIVSNTGMRTTERGLYAGEELSAELGAALLAMHCGIDQQAGASTENSAAYIGYWIQYLQHEPTAFRNAMNQAQKAVSYVLGEAANEVEAGEC